MAVNFGSLITLLPLSFRNSIIFSLGNFSENFFPENKRRINVYSVFKEKVQYIKARFFKRYSFSHLKLRVGERRITIAYYMQIHAIDSNIPQFNLILSAQTCSMPADIGLPWKVCWSYCMVPAKCNYTESVNTIYLYSGTWLKTKMCTRLRIEHCMSCYQFIGKCLSG